MVDGGKIMHLHVTSNEFDTGVSFSADETQYTYGDSVTISITGKGERFAGFKFGVQVEFTGNDGEAMGYFHNLSTALTATPACSTSVYLDAGMGNGTHSFQWTPHYEATGLGLKTTGNATFKIVYGNGPGNAGYEQIAAPALYLQTITLWDPKQWNPGAPAPAPAGPPPPAKACFNATKNSFKGSPVFIQRVGKVAGTGKTQGGASQTFMANGCLRCRYDQHCRSAMVVCPTKPGMVPVEHIWHTDPECNGTADRVAGLKESEAWCPGPEHYSPENLNLTRFVPKLLRDQAPYFQDAATAERAIEEYKRMLTLVQRFPDAPVVPSKLVDIVWHEHVLDTQTYQRDCLRMFGHYLHHAPSFGNDTDEKAEMVQQQQDMLQLYSNEFGESAGRDMWPMTPSDPSSDEKMPDCCSALCVKPSCAGCVGCNSVFCGYRAIDLPAEERIKRTLLAPEQFAGYVPTVDPQRIPQLDGAFAGYQCGVSPTQQMQLGWSISNGYIYFKQQLTGNAWYGVGLNNASMMAGADFMITMAAGKGNTAFGQNNFSGVKDMYLFGGAAGYPCWDIEAECSVGNTTKGTHDLEDQVINRQVGVTYSTWNRKLDTGDFKDYVITEAEAFALFAWGDLDSNGDEFQYHKDNAVVCSVDFYTGASTC